MLEEVHLHHLLGDGRTALEPGVAAEVLQRGAQDALEVEALVFEEIGVLGGEHGVTHHIGDVLDRHRLAVALGEADRSARRRGTVDRRERSGNVRSNWSGSQM